MSNFVEEVETAAVETEAPAQEAEAPVKKKRTRKVETDENGQPVAKAPKAKKEPKEKKAPSFAMKNKFIKVLVKAEDAKLRVGSGRYQFLKAAEDVTSVSDLIGKKFDVGGKEVTLNASNIAGMFSRGHVALSTDGENWEKVSTEIVPA